MAPAQVYAATGRRKNAVARVWLQNGNGKIEVNGREVKDYLKLESLHSLATRPLSAIEGISKFDLRITAHGGGPAGQAGAISHGIARALVSFDPNLRGTLKKKGYLTRDPRMKERKKAGQPGARKRFQFSKR
ncbi:MAG: 30S ribosomal protein S9 [Verrucomicrobiae bacterium]|nr:30S ribosomal protein S9 [Verrucomicrobiae bacterium]